MDEINETARIGKKLAPYNPTNLECIHLALDIFELRSEDILYDLGCGDARLLVEAKNRIPDIKILGIEYDFQLVELARKNLSDHQAIIHENVLNIDITPATAIFIYLVPEGIAAIRDSLLSALSRNVKIITYVFSIPGLQPIHVEIYKKSTKLYLYTRASLSESTRY